MAADVLAARYHLRRVYCDGRTTTELILLDDLTRFGRNAETVDVVLTSAVYSNMISRDHAKIMAHRDNGGRVLQYFIQDNSLNGTYINDMRVKEIVLLKDCDVIKFGHMNGAAIKPGAHAPQANAEFAFMFEKAQPGMHYMGCNDLGKRIRPLVCQANGQGLAEANVRRDAPSMPSQIAPQVSTPAAHVFQQPDLNALLLSQNYMQANNMLNLARMIQQQPFNPFGNRNMFPHLPQMSPLLAQSTAAAASPAVAAPSHLSSHPATSSLAGETKGGTKGSSRVSSSSSSAPLRSPPMECDSTAPDLPKPKSTSSEDSPHKKEEEDSYAYSPPRAPRMKQHSPSPSPSSTASSSRLLKEDIKPPAPIALPKTAAPKKPVVAPAKAPKGAAGDRQKNNEVSRLLEDLTESSFMTIARRTSTGAGSERRRLQDEGRKVKKKEVKKHELMKQISDVSSSDLSSDDEDSRKKKKSVPSSARKVSPQKRKSSARSGDESTTDSDDGSEKGKKKRKSLKKKSSTRASPKKAEKRRLSTGKKAEMESKNEGADEDGYVEPTIDEDFVDDNAPCEMQPCKRPGLGMVTWVQCDECDKWVHTYCFFGHNDVPFTMKEKFYCCSRLPGTSKTKKFKK